MSAEVLDRAFGEVSSVLATMSPDDMERPTPCASWKVRDLVNHVAASPTFFAVTAETGVAPARDAGDDLASGDYRAAFREGATRAVSAFEADGAMDKTMKLPFGELPGGVFVMIASTDMFTHAWDLAKATGRSTDLDPQLAAQLLEFARAALHEEMRGPDGVAPFGAEVEIDEGAPAADRLAAFMGRQP
jgi:uncharacterized protein (TIGR03086 family)